MGLGSVDVFVQQFGEDLNRGYGDVGVFVGEEVDDRGCGGGVGEFGVEGGAGAAGVAGGTGPKIEVSDRSVGGWGLRSVKLNRGGGRPM